MNLSRGWRFLEVLNYMSQVCNIVVQSDMLSLVFFRKPTTMLTGVHSTPNTPMSLEISMVLPGLGAVPLLGAAR